MRGTGRRAPKLSWFTLIMLTALAAGCGGSDTRSESTTSSTSATEEPELVGTWVTDTWVRKAGNVLTDVPSTLPAELWLIERPANCTEPCELNLTTRPVRNVPGSFTMKLRPEDGHYEAAFHFVSGCVHPTTRKVLERRASEIDNTYEVRLQSQGAEETLAIRATWDGAPTAAGVAAGCTIRRALFETIARRPD